MESSLKECRLAGISSDHYCIIITGQTPSKDIQITFVSHLLLTREFVTVLSKSGFWGDEEQVKEEQIPLCLPTACKCRASEGVEAGTETRQPMIELASKACPSTHRPHMIMFLVVCCAKPTACTLAGVTAEVRSNEIDIGIFVDSLLILY